MTGLYSLFFKRSAERELRKLPQGVLVKVLRKIKGLIQNPRPPGSEKLSIQERYRVRQGDYRIVYSVDDKQKKVEIVKIGHRREVYRK